MINQPQRLWWNQARSDYQLFIRLRRDGVHECHLLHYLQMTTEKLSKAYFWRSGNAPPKAHTGFVKFLRALLDRRGDQDQIAITLGFERSDDLTKWVRDVLQLAYALQNIAPAEAGDGPNPEYPWPHQAPTVCPANHSFDLWKKIAETGKGRKLMDFVGRAIAKFESYA